MKVPSDSPRFDAMSISFIRAYIFFPIISLYISLKLIPHIGLGNKNFNNFIYLVYFLSTIMLPLINILFLIRSKKVSSLEMANHKERSLPLFISAIWIWFGYYSLEKILVLSPILKSEILGIIIITVIASVISKYWKISLHMLGIGGVIGVLISLNILFGGMGKAIIIAILFAGILGVARLHEKAHNHTQIYAGLILGCLIEVCAILVF